MADQLSDLARRALPHFVNETATVHTVGDVEDGTHCCMATACTPWERDDAGALVIDAETGMPVQRWWCGCVPPPPPDAP